MSFQAYLDNIKAKTGKTPADFAKLAAKKGLTRHGEIVAWLRREFALGHGHATAIAAVLLKTDVRKAGPEQRLDAVLGQEGCLAPALREAPRASYEVRTRHDDLGQRDVRQSGSGEEEVRHSSAVSGRPPGHRRQAKGGETGGSLRSCWLLEHDGDSPHPDRRPCRDRRRGSFLVEERL